MTSAEHPVIFLLIAFVLVAATIIGHRVSKKAGVRRVLAYGATQGWEMLLIDSFSRSEDEFTRTCYAIRFRDRDGAVVEGVIEAQGDSLRLAQSVRIAPEIARAILDKNIGMDCRKCGNSIPPLAEQCPYCRAWRHEIRMP